MQSLSAARPPAQYVTAPGSQFRLIANEYDKNKYAQCNYASYRTLLRCKQVRSKEELAKNGGRCEEHVEFSKVLEENHRKEVQRCHAENDTKMQRRRFDPWIASNEYISDEDDFLQAIGTLPLEFQNPVNDNTLDDHPLRYARYYTDKDLLKIKIDLVQKDIENLIEFKELITTQARKEHDSSGKNNTDDRPTDIPQQRFFDASDRYARNDYLTLTTVDPVYNKCCVGPDMDDAVVVQHTVHCLLDKIDNFTPISIEKQCHKPAIHLSKFCFDHITLDHRQKMFDVCHACGVTAIGGSNPMCSFHLKSHVKMGTTSCPCNKCALPNEISTSIVEVPTRCIIDSDDEEDTRLANLSRIETMVSPMQQFAPPLPTHLSSAPPARRYHGAPAQVLRPPQMGPPPGAPTSSASKTAAQRVVANLSNQFPSHARSRFDDHQLQKLQEEEAKSMSCARVRPASPSQYGPGKKIPDQQQKLQSSPTVYNQKPPMPSIVSPTTSSPVRSTSQYAGWRNPSGATPRTMHQLHQMGPPTRYPVQQQRYQPNSFSFDRAQEPQTADELVEDRGSPPPPKYPGPDPPRRGVPYYKNVSAYRKTEQPSRHLGAPPPASSSSSTHSSPILAPSPHPSPQMQRFRPVGSRLPMPPHRAIAAGLNPADVVNASTPRPSYRMALPLQQPQQQSHPSPQQFQHQQDPQHNSEPIMAMTVGNPAPGFNLSSRRPGQIPPHRMKGGTGTTPSKVTTSYTVISSNPSLIPYSSFPMTSSSRYYGQLAHPSLDSARHDARFANMNVKTFLSMGNKDLSSMTQEEIDQLAASQDKRKGATAQSTLGSPPSSSSSVLHGQEETPLFPAESLPVTPGTSASRTPTTRIYRKRKNEETLKTTPAPINAISSSQDSEVGEGSVPVTEQNVSPPISTATSTGEPAAKKSTNSGASSPTKPVQMDKSAQEPAKCAKSTDEQTTSTHSVPSAPTGRAPRAAAIAANQAISTHKVVTSPPAAQPTAAAANQQDASQDASGSGASGGKSNPLDMLAELSEAVAANEKVLDAKTKDKKKASKKTAPKGSAPSTLCAPSTSSALSTSSETPTQRRSSRKVSREASEEYEEEL
ncbi:unnamed protein product [Caenorhabditis sp. 36 PRJEB53466]|nr:unnamed protein product [Caenorhabditis sp. 36 PRJEB53466]